MRPDPRVGTDLAGYRIIGRLGRGATSVVYVADDPRLGRRVALKVLEEEFSEDARFRERFVQESRVAAGLDHPNVIPIYEAGDREGVLFIAMRFVPGGDLGVLVAREGPLGPARALAILGQVASALDAAHRQGLVHRDVKPANVLLDIRGGADHAYLSDFGVTKRLDDVDGMTRSGRLVGTIDYASPEQLEGRPLDARADVYSLGCLVYECLTAARPFERETLIAVIDAHRHDPPPAVTDRRPDLPQALNGVIAQAMGKSPMDRFASCPDLIDAAWQAVRGGSEAAADGGVIAAVIPEPEVVGTEDRETVVEAQSAPPTVVSASEGGAGSQAGRKKLGKRAVTVAVLIVLAASAGVTLVATRIGSGPVVGPTPPVSLGPRIVFVAHLSTTQSNLYVMSPDGSHALPLTRDDSLDGSPSWSPDGRQIAFQSNRSGSTQIYVMGASGSHVRQLTEGAATNMSPAWSPDGRSIAYVSVSGQSDAIFVMRPDGTDSRKVVSVVGARAAPTWSPDSSRLVFVSGHGMQSKLYVVDVSGDAKPVALTHGESRDIRPAWSPAPGNVVAFGRIVRRGPSHIYVIALKDGSAKQLTYGPADDTGPVWSPDASRILFVRTDSAGVQSLLVMNADGSDLKPVGSFAFGATGLDWIGP